ncbi:MAG TPA: hypothetical protein VK797_03805 [Tepidisphaeraceae bacterium]|jgi:hypothetical protein|nr:hypothetical protein [Tepidisphaeraceae bacterium]
MPEQSARNLDLSRIKGQKLLDQLQLSAKDREWAQKHGEELICLFLRDLSERLEPGISFRAIPAVFAYARAVIEAGYETPSS